MNNKQTKKATVDAINVMIRHADQGPFRILGGGSRRLWQSSGLSGI